MTQRPIPPPEQRCSAYIHRTTAQVAQCLRKGIIEEDGKLWCSQHAPTRKAERQREIDVAYKARAEEQRRTQQQAEWDRVIKKVGEHNRELAAALLRFAHQHDILD